MSLQIDDLDQIDGESTQTSNDDIFSNPLEAFPEFIDEPVSAPVSTDTTEPAAEDIKEEIPAEKPAAEPVEEIKKTEPVKNEHRSLLSTYVDPLDTIEEIDLSTLSQTVTDFSFDDDSSAVQTKETESSFFEKSNFTLGSMEYEDVAVRKSDMLYEIEDTEPEVSEETEEISVDDFLSPGGTETEEVDLDAFLGDSGFSDSGVSINVTEEVSLDDFMDFSGLDADAGIDAAAIDAFAASTREKKQEKSDIENAPAIEMELEFDDDFVLETKANPEDDIDFDFEALMAGESIPVPPQATTGDELLDNFDDIFDSIVDEGAPSPSAASTSGSEIEFDPSAIEEVSLDAFGLGDGSSDSPAVSSPEHISEQQIVYDEVSEFDDLLSSFSDETHVEVAEKQHTSDNASGPHDYNIIVIMDDDETDTIQQMEPAAESGEEEEDYQVTLFSSEDDAEKYRRHETAPAPQESIASSGSEIEFDPDSVPSDTFEDISLDDFGVSFEDETPARENEPAVESAVAETTDIPSEEPDFIEESAESEAIPDGLDIPEDEPELDIDVIPDMQDEIEFPEEPLPDMPDFVPETPEPHEISYEEQFGDVPTVDNILKEAESAVPEPAQDEETLPECEDTTVDDKIIVDKSEDSVYNGDNTEYTSNLIDGNNEEITDTMDSMNEGLLEKIVSELSVLRNEMQSLRDEVQTLKGGSEPAAEADFEAPAFDEPAVEESAIPADETPEADIPLPEADPFAAPQDAGGFFSGDDDDETIALSGDELNNILNSADFTQEDGSDFAMEAPEGLGDDFAIEEPVADEAAAPADEFAIEEPVTEEAVPSDDFVMEEPAVEEEVSVDDFVTEEPAVEEAPATDDFMMEEPVAEEAPAAADDFAIDDSIPDETAPAVDDFDIDFDEPAAEEPVLEKSAPVTEEANIDDFDTDLPSLKEDAEEPFAEESVSEEAPAAEDDFSLDDFDIPEPTVDENSIENFDIDDPEPKAEEEFSLDEFDIPEPSVDENSIADIDIDEPSAEIPSDEPVVSEEAPAETEDADSDFYANSDSPAIPEEAISAIDIQDNLEEPVLDDIDFNMDEPSAEDIEIPTGESLIVDSSSTDFLEEDDPTLDEQLTSDKVDYLNEEASADDLASLPEIEDIPDAAEDVPAVESMEDSLEADTLATSEDETPADDMFSSQWDAAPTESVSFDEEPEEEEIVQAAKSFDDPIGFDIEDAPAEEPVAEEAPAEDNFDVISDYEAPAAEEPVAETPSAEEMSGDIKNEVKSVLKYMDQLLENLPEDKIAEFAQSEHFETYKKLFNELGLV